LSSVRDAAAADATTIAADATPIAADATTTESIHNASLEYEWRRCQFDAGWWSTTRKW
jgi:hypothetical protein